ncbi:phage recombination protein Bet [Patescibacteria group bacterium]|nr:phage recombination protein Bet [Patescibacteria group bacterium]
MDNKGALIARFSQKFGIDERKLFEILKATCFKQRDKDQPVTDAQMAALLVVADQYNLNPFTREIFAFPDKQKGIVPIVSIDGWIRIINSHPQFNGLDCVNSQVVVDVPETTKRSPEWTTCNIHRKDRTNPTSITEYFDECYRPPFVGTDSRGKPYSIPGPWQSHPRRMLRHKSIIQCARIAFGFSGIYDEDDVERGEVVNVTPVETKNISAPVLGENITWQDRLQIQSENVNWGFDQSTLKSFVSQTAKIHNVTENDLLDRAADNSDSFWDAANAWALKQIEPQEIVFSADLPADPTTEPAPEPAVDPQSEPETEQTTAGSPAKKVDLTDIWDMALSLKTDARECLLDAGLEPDQVLAYWKKHNIHKNPKEFGTALDEALKNPGPLKEYLASLK